MVQRPVFYINGWAYTRSSSKRFKEAGKMNSGLSNCDK